MKPGSGLLFASTQGELKVELTTPSVSFSCRKVWEYIAPSLILLIPFTYEMSLCTPAFVSERL